MTDAPYGGVPPTNPDLGFGASSSDTGSWTAGASEPGTGSTTDSAKEQAAQVGQTAKESGQKVAGIAVEQGTNVLDEGKAQARNLTHEVKGQVHEQSSAQKDRAAAGLRNLGDELRSMVENGSQSGQPGQSGVATDLARQAATKAHDLAGWLESRDPGSIVDELRSMARSKPGTFLLGAVAAGVLAGRMTRGAVDAAKSDSNDSNRLATDSGGATSGSDYALPAAPVAGTSADDYAGTTTIGLPSDPVTVGQSSLGYTDMSTGAPR